MICRHGLLARPSEWSRRVHVVQCVADGQVAYLVGIGTALGPVASRENVTFFIFCRSRALPPRCHGGQRWRVQREKGTPLSHVCRCVSLCVRGRNRLGQEGGCH